MSALTVIQERGVGWWVVDPARWPTCAPVAGPFKDRGEAYEAMMRRRRAASSGERHGDAEDLPDDEVKRAKEEPPKPPHDRHG